VALNDWLIIARPNQTEERAANASARDASTYLIQAGHLTTGTDEQTANADGISKKNPGMAGVLDTDRLNQLALAARRAFSSAMTFSAT
jgi:hypothetical protein